MLTTDEMMKIMQEEVNEKEPTIRSPEANDFREDLAKDIAKAKKNGWVIEIPGEWEAGEVEENE